MNYDLIADLPFFLAYSLEMEKEAAERLRNCAAQMDAENHEDLAETFAELATFSAEHATEIAAICRNLGLAEASAQEMVEPIELPQPFDCDEVTYKLSNREAVEAMLAQEKESAEFYSEVANRTINKEIRKFALEFAEEEREHAQALTEWLSKLPANE